MHDTFAMTMWGIDDLRFDALDDAACHSRILVIPGLQYDDISRPVLQALRWNGEAVVPSSLQF